jgi:hypothetical protein
MRQRFAHQRSPPIVRDNDKTPVSLRTEERYTVEAFARAWYAGTRPSLGFSLDKGDPVVRQNALGLSCPKAMSASLFESSAGEPGEIIWAWCALGNILTRDYQSVSRFHPEFHLR